MLLIENIRMALNGLIANKMRAVLTMLGIIIGIGSVIGIMSIGTSLSGSVADSMSGLGANNVTVSLTKKDSENSKNGSFMMFGRSNPEDSDLITDEIIDEYRNLYSAYIQEIYYTTSVGTGVVGYGDDEENLSITGVSTEYLSSNDVEILSGRGITQGDIDNLKYVIVISSKLAGSLFPMQEPVGKAISVTVNNGISTFYVAGVFDDSENESSTTQAYIPISTANRITGTNGVGYQSFTVVTTTDTNVSDFIDRTDDYFSQVYNRNKSYTRTSSSMQTMLETLTSMLTSISLAISAIRAISLLVGGIGVMNIMLVSVTERTREIGTRKALGATNTSILQQFIVESIIICLIGGSIGVCLGYCIGLIAGKLVGFSVKMSLTSVLIAGGFSMAIGVFFGYYPANKAAKLDPIEALRYE